MPQGFTEPLKAAEVTLRIGKPSQHRSERCEVLPDTVAGLTLACLTPGPGLCFLSAASKNWAQAARHPELWWRLCTRGPSPLVLPGLVHITASQRAKAWTPASWLHLAQSGRGVVTTGWRADVDPQRLWDLLKELREGTSTWRSLTTLSSSQKEEVPEQQKKVEVTTKAVTSPFLRCEELFPLYGGFSFTIEEEILHCPAARGQGEARHGSLPHLLPSACNDEGRLWVRLSTPPSGPLAVQCFILGPCEVCINLQFELRADAGYTGLRLTGRGIEPRALQALRALTRNGPLSIALGAGPPPVDTEGYPGGSGWIPWAPKPPTLALVNHI